MIISTLHVLSCMTLAIAAVYWRCTRAAENGAHRFLFPYLMTAGVLGLAWLMIPIVKVAMFYVTDNTYIVIRNPSHGQYAWAFYPLILLPVLPCIGIFAAIGKRPRLMASFALLTMLPAAFEIYSELIFNP